MVDAVSAEDRRKELLEESLKYTYPEDTAGIKLRYKDTALVLFKEGHNDPKSFLSFGTRRSSSVSQYGNTPVIVRRSRSSNGELSMVAEQWPSISARTSVSNYTLVEARERDEEESDTEDELDIAAKKFGELQELNEVVEGDITEDKPGVESRESKESHGEAEADKKELERNVTLHETRKSFMHYDLPIQRPKPEKSVEDFEDIIEQGKSDEKQRDESNQDVETIKEKEIDAPETDLKVTVQDQLSKEDESVGPKESDVKAESPLSRKPECSSVVVDVHVRKESGGNFKSEILRVESHEEKIVKRELPPVEITSGSRSFESASSHIEEIGQFTYEQHFSKFENTELKIVEPTDIESTTKTVEDSISVQLSTKAVDEDDDDDDLEFVDAISPVSPKIDIRSDKQSPTSQTSGEEESPIAVSAPSSPYHIKTQDEVKVNSSPSHTASEATNGKQTDDLNKSIELEESTKFLELPVRSPTPPKKSPRRSPRSPKSKEASQGRHSSLILPLQTEPQVNVPKGTRSASPTTKMKEPARIFTFSLKREKSKSASSLNVRRGKDKDRSPHKEPAAESLILKTDEMSDAQLEAFGKRVGVRSMVIDGTIKRNFIVIHPSDESDTIGLAPKSVISNGDSSTHTKPPRALSSVKSHISGKTSKKIESIQKISLTKDIKEELSSSLPSPTALGPVPKKTRSRKSRSMEKMRESTRSLSSQPTSDSLTGLQMMRSASGLSQVDCDSINMSSQSLNLNKNKVTSKLCSIM